jgi:hypothetical protein
VFESDISESEKNSFAIALIIFVFLSSVLSIAEAVRQVIRSVQPSAKNITLVNSTELPNQSKNDTQNLNHPDTPPKVFVSSTII